jgi:hypothetical protein
MFVAVQYGMLLQPILVKDFLLRVMLLLFLGAGLGLLVLCTKVTSSFCMYVCMYPVLNVICVYAVNRLYVEKEQKSFLVLNRWCCATSVTSSILFNCYLRL